MFTELYFCLKKIVVIYKGACFLPQKKKYEVESGLYNNTNWTNCVLALNKLQAFLEILK